MARPSNTGQRREEIVEALLRVMASEGYEGATIPEIARAAGLRPGLIHYHFESKEEILLELFDRLRRTVEERFRGRLAGIRSLPRGRLHAFLDAHLELGKDADRDAMVCWVAMGAEALRRPALRTLYRQAIFHRLDRLEGLVREALAAERRSAARAPEIASGLLAAIEGAFKLGCAAPRAIPPGSAAATIRRMADGLLDTEPSIRRAP